MTSVFESTLDWVRDKQVSGHIWKFPNPPCFRAEVVEVAVILISGELLAELKVETTTSVGQIKWELAKHDRIRTPIARLQLFLQDEDSCTPLSDGTLLQELYKGDQQKITFELIRLSWYPLEKLDSHCEEDLLFKIFVVGDSRAGKTNLISRFASNTFTDKFIPTLEIHSENQMMAVQDGIDRTRVLCEICDTAGQERFHRAMSSYYRTAHGMMVVCDVTDKDFFNTLRIFLDEITRKADEHVALCVVSNKVDLVDQRQVTFAEVDALAAKHGAGYFEVSAKNNDNVDVPFQYLVTVLLDRFRDSSPRQV